MMGYNGSPNKYVCPNDRQLSLRAKLRTGWCVPRGVSPLTPAEQAAILEVIRRSEALGLAEARRVGRLVERVESLRRSTQPAPAAATPPPSRCSAARCRACSRRAPLLSPLKTCAGCRQRFCNKCCAESAINSDRWLCSLCSETREMWKKSGAWFYHGLPQYILPERRESGAPGISAVACAQGSSRDSFHQDSLLRRGSCVASYRSMSALQEGVDNDLDSLHHGFSGLSLNRMESFSRSGPGLRRTPSKGSSRSLASSPSHNPLQNPPLATIEQNTVYTGSSVPYGQNNLTANGQTTMAVSATPLNAALGTCGSAEVRLQHDAADGTLHCTAVRARGLPSTDLAGLADPYCCMEILPPEGTTCSRLRTKTVHKTRNPEFNETVTFHGVAESDLDSKTFRITFFDEDKYGCDILGSASLPLVGALSGGRPQDITLPLSAEEALGERLMKPQLLVSLCYNTKRRALAVLVCRCRNLPAMDSNGFSDPFIKLHLEPDPYHRKHKTSIKWRNLNPIYNEEFFFDTRPTELSKQSLALTVWDKDYGKPNDFLGSLVIGSASKGKRLKHWLDCIKFPDHRHEQWHCLTETEP